MVHKHEVVSETEIASDELYCSVAVAAVCNFVMVDLNMVCLIRGMLEGPWRLVVHKSLTQRPLAKALEPACVQQQ